MNQFDEKFRKQKQVYIIRKFRNHDLLFWFYDVKTTKHECSCQFQVLMFKNRFDVQLRGNVRLDCRMT